MLNDAYAIDLDLPAGEHPVIGQVVSGRGGWALGIEATSQLDRVTRSGGWSIEATRRLEAQDLAHVISLTVEADDLSRLRLNGMPLPLSDDGIMLRRYLGLPPNWLRRGTNTLTCRWDPTESADGLAVEPLRLFSASAGRRRLVPTGQVLALNPAAVGFDIPPIVGSDAPDRLTFSCRTNAAVGLTLDIAGRRVRSPVGVEHRLRVDGLTPGQHYDYRLATPGGAIEGRAVTWPLGSTFRLAICADAGPLPEVWRTTAAAVAAARPDVVVFTGDLVNDGLQDEQWPSFAQDAADLLGSVPFFSVLGNHDHDAPLYRRLFAPPAAVRTDGRHWAQRIGHTVMIGIDGAQDFSPQAESRCWLEQQLRQAHDADFILVFNHYPAWSSGPHAATDQRGRLREPACRTARELIIPLLEEHQVSLYFCGHDHVYERSVLPSGLTHVVSGGAGAYLYGGGNGQPTNPHACCFQSEHHYCLLSFDTRGCRGRATTARGDILDRFEVCPRSPLRSVAQKNP